MGASDILNRISRLRKEIRELEKLKTKYKNMKTKIEDGIEELKFARSYLEEAHIRLNENYDSEVAKQKVSELQGEFENIVAMRNLAGNMVEMANSRIEQITNEIQRKEEQIESLEEQLASMEE